MMKQLRLVCFVLLTLCQALPGAAQTKSGQEKKTSHDDAAQESVIIEELSTTTRFERDGSSTETVHQRVKVQTEAGLKQYGIITFGFIAGQKFNIDTVEVHKKDGSIVKAGAADTHEITPAVSRAAPMYSDLRQKQVTVPGLAIGDEVVFQYSARRTPLVPNQFWFQYSFTKDAVVRSESVEVNVPKGLKLSLSYQPEYKPVITDSDDRTVYRWHASNEKSVEAKKKTALRQATAMGTGPSPSIELSTFASWQQIGDWYWKLQRDRVTPSPAIKARALELTKGLEKPEDKIKALYRFVSEDFRYISLDFGIGRYQPHAADEVFSNKYGDCKDKHTLLAALLEASGIQAFPALMNSRREVDPAVPSPAQFDHVVTAVPSGTGFIFLDTTAEVAPYGFLIAPLRHKKALVVSGSGTAQFVETPADLPFHAQEVFDFNGKIDDSGTMEAEVSFFLRGDSEVLLKSAFREVPPGKYKDIVQVLSLTSGFGGEVSNIKLDGMDDLEGGLRISYHYHRTNYVDLTDKPPENSLPIAAINLPPWDEDDETVRLQTSTLDLIYKCKVELPPGVTVQAPLPVKLDRAYARYQSNYSAEKNVLTGERKVSVLSPVVAAPHRQDYEAFLRAANADQAQQMVLHLPLGFVAKSAATPAAGLDELMQQAEIEYRERNYTDALADYRKIAKQDPKRKGVWRQIALVEQHLRRYDQSVDDFQKAIQADPFDARAHAELGGAYLTLHRNKLAVLELKKALEIDPLDHRAYYLLGWYQAMVAKDYAAAVPALEKALSTEGDGFNDEEQIRDLLSDGYFKTRQPEKALGILKDLIETASNPLLLNNVAYSLADNNYRLDLARQYADSALQGIYEHLNQVEPDSIRRRDLAYMAQLVLTWDTMGWVHFKAGDLPVAEKYVHAAWILGQQREVGEHMGEIYEKMGRPRLAMRFYAMSVNNTYGVRGKDLARERLVKLAGRRRAEQMISDLAGESSQLRTVHLGKIAPSGTKGMFSFIFSPGPKLVSVQLMGGSERLREALMKQGAKLAATVVFPENAPQKLVRQGIVDCSRYTGGCNVVFLINDSSSLNMTSGTAQ